MSNALLQKLKLDQLRCLARLVGSPCSGTKAVRIKGIQDVVARAADIEQQTKANPNSLSIVSIDMGIRNLAYCHLKPAQSFLHGSKKSPIAVDAWQRLTIAPSATRKSVKALRDDNPGADTGQTAGPKTTSKESFEPDFYARQAYSLIKGIIDTHKPSHLLIERQRFRSGGASAVQEWTIRVGMFEAMLHATVRTLVEQGYCRCEVVPMSPPAINRFCLQEADTVSSVPSKATTMVRKSSAVKLHKIELVRQSLATKSFEDTSITLTGAATTAGILLLSKNGKDKHREHGTAAKLDDLADCLLQGLTWLKWQQNAADIDALIAQEIRTT